MVIDCSLRLTHITADNKLKAYATSGLLDITHTVTFQTLTTEVPLNKNYASELTIMYSA